jgi:hypothetical protein
MRSLSHTIATDAKRFGVAGAIVLVISWLLFLTISSLRVALPDGWGPGIWTMLLGVGFPMAFGLGVFASDASKWWCLVSGISLVGIGVLVLGAPGIP